MSGEKTEQLILEVKKNYIRPIW